MAQDDITLPRIADGDTPWKVARWVLFLTYLYYNRGVSLVDDDEYDAMCAEVADVYGDLPEHEQTMLGDPEELRYTGIGCAFSRLVVRQAETLAQALGEDVGHEAWDPTHTCECCGCDLILVRG